MPNSIVMCPTLEWQKAPDVTKNPISVANYTTNIGFILSKIDLYCNFSHSSSDACQRSYCSYSGCITQPWQPFG